MTKRIIAIYAGLLLAFGASSVSAEKPLPGADAIASGKRLVLDTFRKEIDGDDKKAAARTLLIAASRSGGDDVGQAALYMVAIDLAAKSGDLQLAFEAVDDMAMQFEIDAPQVKVKYLDAAVKDARSAEARTAVVDSALELIDEAALADAFDVADSALKAAQSMAAKLRDADLRKDLAAKRRALDARRKDYAAFEKKLSEAKAKLAKSPDDRRANQIVGQHLAFDRLEWQEALKHFSRAEDDALRRAATADLGRPADPREQMLLADSWWNLAESVDDHKTRTGYRNRAVYWYSLALPTVSGLLHARAEKRIEEAGAAASRAATEQVLAGNGPPVDLLTLVDVKRDHVSGQWALVNGNLESPKQNGARIEAPYQPPSEYRLTVIAEPLDAPDGLVLGVRLGERRVLVCLNAFGTSTPLCELENVNGAAAAVSKGAVFKKGQPSQIVCTVRSTGILVLVDGRQVINWQGDAASLSVDDYWQTPRKNAIFIGAYDTRYRISRFVLKPLAGTGQALASKPGN